MVTENAGGGVGQNAENRNGSLLPQAARIALCISSRLFSTQCAVEIIDAITEVILFLLLAKITQKLCLPLHRKDATASVRCTIHPILHF
jgi:hypothetical protein